MQFSWHHFIYDQSHKPHINSHAISSPSGPNPHHPTPSHLAAPLESRHAPADWSCLTGVTPEPALIAGDRSCRLRLMPLYGRPVCPADKRQPELVCRLCFRTLRRPLRGGDHAVWEFDRNWQPSLGVILECYLSLGVYACGRIRRLSHCDEWRRLLSKCFTR